MIKILIRNNGDFYFYKIFNIFGIMKVSIHKGYHTRLTHTNKDLKFKCYVKELPFFEINSNSEISISYFNKDIDNYIRNSTIHNDYHIVWKYQYTHWFFSVYTKDRRLYAFDYFDKYPNKYSSAHEVPPNIYGGHGNIKNKEHIPSVIGFIKNKLDHWDFALNFILNSTTPNRKELVENCKKLTSDTFSFHNNYFYADFDECTKSREFKLLSMFENDIIKKVTVGNITLQVPYWKIAEEEYKKLKRKMYRKTLSTIEFRFELSDRTHQFIIEFYLQYLYGNKTGTYHYWCRSIDNVNNLYELDRV